jgi:hypothetical protein
MTVTWIQHLLQMNNSPVESRIYDVLFDFRPSVSVNILSVLLLCFQSVSRREFLYHSLSRIDVFILYILIDNDSVLSPKSWIYCKRFRAVIRSCRKRKKITCDIDCLNICVCQNHSGVLPEYPSLREIFELWSYNTWCSDSLLYLAW